MAVLMDLPGLKQKEIECVPITNANDIYKILNSGKAVSCAGKNGAINIWRDDSGWKRCEFMRYGVTYNTKRYATYIYAKKWFKEYIKKIE
jgi:hypothetical protein